MSTPRDGARLNVHDIGHEADSLYSLLQRQRDQPHTADMIVTYRRRAANIREALDRLNAAINQMEPE